MSGFKGLALVNSKKNMAAEWMAFQSLIQVNLGNSLSKSQEKLGTLAGRTAGVERGQSRVCQILFIFSDQELEAYTAQSLAPGPHH